MSEIPSPEPQETEQSATGERIPIGEPVTRPDGMIVRLERSGSKLTVRYGSSNIDYTDDEVSLLGNGDWKTGAMRIAQAYYKADQEQLLPGTWRLLEDEINPRD